MSRQEATNVFNGGMISDLNPLTTPDNVLTDCLNGTFITYNGNEFVLQNDQGNYNLENAKLKPDFIPVGIREYGDILYIVSYNPITKESEIGSYPSPRTIFTTKDRDYRVQFTPIIPDENGETDYEKLTQKAKLQLYALSNDMENFKLNPGDLFTVLLDKSNTFPYQNIQFAILNDDKNLIPIDIPDEYIWPYGTHIDDKDFKPVFWKLPGWLTGKYKLAVIDQFYLNVREIVMPEFTDSEIFDIQTISLNSQLSISDNLFTENSNTINDLKIEYKCWAIDSRTPNIEIPITLISSDLIGNKSNILRTHNYNDLSTIYFHNLSFSAVGRNRFETIFIEAVPVLINGENTVYYNQFRTTQSFNLATINDAKDITAADIIYWYVTDNDSLTLTFNINGPFVNNSSISANLELYSLNNATVDNIKNKLVYNEQLSEINFFGQNIVDINFGNHSPYTENFVNENMYILSIIFMQSGSILKRINKLLISSETFNAHSASYNNFDDIYLEEWLYKYGNYVKKINFANSIENTKISTIDNWAPTTEQWVNNIRITPSKTQEPTMIFTPEDRKYNWFSTQLTIPSAPSYFYGSNYNTKILLNPNNTYIKGLLWNDVQSNNTLSYTISNFQGDTIQKETPDSFSQPFSLEFISQFGGAVNCRYERLTNVSVQIPSYNTVFPYVLLDNATTVPVMIVSLDRETSGGNDRTVILNGRSATLSMSTGLYTVGTAAPVRLNFGKEPNIFPTNSNIFINYINNGFNSSNFMLLVFGKFTGDGDMLGYENPYIGRSGGPLVYAAFRSVDGTISIFPFYNQQGAEHAIGKMPPLSANWTGGTIDPDVIAGIRQLGKAFYHVRDIQSNTKGFFLQPIANSSLISSNIIKNFIADINVNDIIYSDKSIINDGYILYQSIQNIESKLLMGVNVYDRLSSNNLQYSQRDDSKLNINVKFDYQLENAISGLNVTDINNQINLLSGFINDTMIPSDPNLAPPAARAQWEMGQSQNDPVVLNNNQPGFYINEAKVLTSEEKSVYKLFWSLLQMNTTTGTTGTARIINNTAYNRNFLLARGSWNNNGPGVRFTYCPPNTTDVYIPITA